MMSRVSQTLFEAQFADLSRFIWDFIYIHTIQTSCAPHSATGCHGNINNVYLELKHHLMLQTMK